MKGSRLVFAFDSWEGKWFWLNLVGHAGTEDRPESSM